MSARAAAVDDEEYVDELDVEEDVDSMRATEPECMRLTLSASVEEDPDPVRGMLPPPPVVSPTLHLLELAAGQLTLVGPYPDDALRHTAWDTFTAAGKMMFWLDVYPDGNALVGRKYGPKLMGLSSITMNVR